MPLLQSEPVLALGYDQLNSGDVGTEAGHVTRKECQAFRGRVSADVKVWQRRPSLAAASEGWEGWKDGRSSHTVTTVPSVRVFFLLPTKGSKF